jgi:hypothetical protein
MPYTHWDVLCYNNKKYPVYYKGFWAGREGNCLFKSGVIFMGVYRRRTSFQQGRATLRPNQGRFYQQRRNLTEQQGQEGESDDSGGGVRHQNRLMHWLGIRQFRRLVRKGRFNARWIERYLHNQQDLEVATNETEQALEEKAYRQSHSQDRTQANNKQDNKQPTKQRNPDSERRARQEHDIDKANHHKRAQDKVANRHYRNNELVKRHLLGEINPHFSGITNTMGLQSQAAHLATPGGQQQQAHQRRHSYPRSQSITGLATRHNYQSREWQQSNDFDNVQMTLHIQTIDRKR